MQPFAVQSGQKINSTDDEDTRDRERRQIQLERKAFQKDCEMVYYVYTTGQSQDSHMYIYIRICMCMISRPRVVDMHAVCHLCLCSGAGGTFASRNWQRKTD